MLDLSSGTDYVIHGDNAEVLPMLPAGGFQLIYIDPPFNTRKKQERRALRTVRDADGDRTGFQGLRYRTEALGRTGYLDSFTNYAEFIGPRLEEARRLLNDSGTLYFHIDQRESHYCKVLLDSIFGRDAFLNEIIWAYDYGGRARDRWPAKHDTILVYVKSPKRHYFSQDQIARIPYMAPGLVSAEKAKRGKLPTDVWWHTIVPTNGKEKTGYPTQKPEGVLRRVLEPSSRPGDWILDFFAGSGTAGAVASRMGRRYVLIDSSRDAIAVMQRRLAGSGVSFLNHSID